MLAFLSTSDGLTPDITSCMCISPPCNCGAPTAGNVIEETVDGLTADQRELLRLSLERTGNAVPQSYLTTTNLMWAAGLIGVLVLVKGMRD